MSGEAIDLSDQMASIGRGARLLISPSRARSCLSKHRANRRSSFFVACNLREAPVRVATTAFGCWLFFDLGRRARFLRVWIGLPSKSQPKPTTLSTQVVGEAR